MKSSVFRTTLTALFLALVFLLGLTPVGIIPLGFVSVTILCVPVVIGTMLLGMGRGLLLGFAFGTASFMAALGVSLTPPSALVAPIVSGNVFLAAVLCYVPRLLVPITTSVVYGAIVKKRGESLKAVPLAAVVGSVTNTVFYLGTMLLIYAILGIDNTYLLSLIGGIALVAGGCEAVVAAILATPIMKALLTQMKKTV